MLFGRQRAGRRHSVWRDGQGRADMTKDYRTPGDADELAQRPLEPPVAGGGIFLRWMVVFLCTSAAGTLWLALRADSPPSVRQLLDTILEMAIGILVALGAYRLLVFFPFRILDLLVIVLGLGLGVKGTLEALESASRSGLLDLGPIDARENLGTLVLSCLLTGSLLLAGAALGLRYCVRLKLSGSGARVAAIVSGMLSFPACVGVFAFPGLILLDLLAEHQLGERALAYLGLGAVSLVVVVANGVFLVRSMALETHVALRPPKESE
jgi:hypothetical protein